MGLKSKIILIYGPTASGKSDFAIQIAKKVKGEIVNADSMQIYKQLKILTARPTKKNFQKITHHLYGINKSNEDFSAGDWLKVATKKINEIKKRKKIPIFHMEAGNRCFDQRVPEEINRKIADHLSDVNIVISNQARDNLLSEGINKEFIFKFGSNMRDVINYYEKNISSYCTLPWSFYRSSRHSIWHSNSIKSDQRL